MFTSLAISPTPLGANFTLPDGLHTKLWQFRGTNAQKTNPWEAQSHRCVFRVR